MRTAHSSAGRKAAAEQAVEGCPAELSPVLVVASPGLEAELVMRLLDNHPAVHARGDELLNTSRGAEELRSAMLTMATDAVRDASMSLRRGAASPLRAVCAIADPAGVEPIERLLAAVPQSRVLCLIRDGRDAVVSDRVASLRAGRFEGLSAAARREAAKAAAFLMGGGSAPARLLCAESLRVHTMRWIAGLRAPLRAVELLGERARIVRYEELVQETIRTHAATCRWLGVAGDAAHVHSAIEASRQQLARAERPGMWRSAMSEADVIGFKRMAGELLIELGFVKDRGW